MLFETERIQGFALNGEHALPLHLTKRLQPISPMLALLPAGAIKPGVNTLSLSASTEPVADVVALVTTTDLTIAIDNSANAAVTVVNVGSSAEITASLDTASAQLPLTAMICRTYSATGECLESMAELSSLSLAASSTASFMIQLAATDFIPFDPAKNRYSSGFTMATECCEAPPAFL